MSETVSVPDLAWPIVLDQRGIICKIETELCEALQQSQEALIGLSIQELFPASRGDSYTLPQESDKRSSFIVRFSEGSPQDALLHITALEDGRYAAELEVPRARHLLRMHQLEARLKALYQSQSQMIVILDREHRVLDFNQQAASAASMRFGHIMEVGECFTRYVTDMDDFLESFKQALQGQNIFKERIIMAPDGKGLAYEMSYVPIYDKQGQISSVCFVGVNQDEQRQMRLKLHQEQNFIDSILDNTTALILVVDPQGRIERFNKACEALTAYSSEEVYRQVFWDVLIPADASEQVQTLFHDIFAKKVTGPVSFNLLNQQGQELTVTWSASILNSVTTDEQYLVFTGSDITPQLLAQNALKESDAMLLQAQKMEAVGHLTGGIAHDFNNVLTALVGYGQLLENSVKDNAEAQEYLDEIMQITQKAKELTGQLLTFSRKAPIDEQIFELPSTLSEMEGLLQQLLGTKITLKLDLPASLPAIRMNKSYLQQVMMNLVVNARDAIKEKGQIIISGKVIAQAKNFAHPVFGRCESGRYVQLSIQDNGMGMSEHVRSHLFDPFFTTKDSEQGTGLGMAVVYRIMEEIGGWVNIQSEPTAR